MVKTKTAAARRKQASTSISPSPWTRPRSSGCWRPSGSVRTSSVRRLSPAVADRRTFQQTAEVARIRPRMLLQRPRRLASIAHVADDGFVKAVFGVDGEGAVEAEASQCGEGAAPVDAALADGDEAGDERRLAARRLGGVGGVLDADNGEPAFDHG